MWFRKPVPPVDVMIHLKDGSSMGVDCVYSGHTRDAKGKPIHHWKAVRTDMPPYNDVDHITVGILPARTQVHF